MRNRKLALGAIVLVVAALAVVLALGTSSGSAKSSATFKAAWIYVGPHDDGGWSQAHDQGRLYVQRMLGSKVKTEYKENVPEGPQVAQVIQQLISDGNKIIFATSFGYQPAMAAAAAKNPDVKFEMATGTIIKPNMA
ncbi:MAG TPA: BMP family ABC transporter substrate-binding protein, partial [Gaiellaceae bacterium]